jgi:hypothetical protein
MLALDLYRGDQQAVADRLRLSLSSAMEKQDAKASAGFIRQLGFTENWQKPEFPLSGADMLSGGLASGPEVGKRLKQLEEKWLASGFSLTKAQLLDS